MGKPEKYGWGLILWTWIIFLAPYVSADGKYIFENVLPALRVGNMEHLYYLAIETVTFNIFTLIGIVIGVIQVKKHGNAGGMKLVYAGIVTVIVTYFLY